MCCACSYGLGTYLQVSGTPPAAVQPYLTVHTRPQCCLSHTCTGTLSYGALTPLARSGCRSATQRTRARGSALQAVGTTDKLIRSKFGSMLTAEKALNWKRIFDNADAPVTARTVITGARMTLSDHGCLYRTVTIQWSERSLR